MRLTICFGGSIVAPSDLNQECISDIVKTVRKLRSKKCELAIVTGGGEPARRYIGLAGKFGASNLQQDQIGIAVTMLNAQLLISALGDVAEASPVTTFEKAVRLMLRDKIPVMGGTTPGQTTDAVAAMLAQSTRSDVLVFFTDVDGVYTADPKLDLNAKKIDNMTPAEFGRLFGGKEYKPGIKTIMDPIAVKLIERSNIKTLVMGRHEIKRLQEIINGAKHSGTTISKVG